MDLQYDRATASGAPSSVDVEPVSPVVAIRHVPDAVDFRDQVADSIGWPKGNPFQIEVGFANVAIGVAGVLCAWYAGRFWLATIVIVSVYLASAAAVHVVDMVRSSNYAPGSAGFVFWWDLALPALLCVLYAVQ
jgi:hypothetical protein